LICGILALLFVNGWSSDREGTMPTETPSNAPTSSIAAGETPKPTPTNSPVLTEEPETVLHFYQGPGKENDLLWYLKNIKSEQVSGFSVIAVNVETEEQIPLAMKNMYWDENVLVLDSTCFAEMTPGLYCLCLDMSGEEGEWTDKLYLEIHSAVEEPKEDGKFVEYNYVWNYPAVSSVSCVLRPDAMRKITEVYMCEQMDSSDPYSEKMSIVYEALYELLEGNRGIQIGEAFWNAYRPQKGFSLYIGFSDGRGEKVWIVCTETE